MGCEHGIVQMKQAKFATQPLLAPVQTKNLPTRTQDFQRPAAPATAALARGSGKRRAWAGGERGIMAKYHSNNKELTALAQLRQPYLDERPCHGRQPRLRLHRPEIGTGKDGV